MKLKQPFIITSRLMAGLRVTPTDYLSIDYLAKSTDGRVIYDIWIDIGGKEYHVTDIGSGCQGGKLQTGMQTLLAFLGTAAEAYSHEQRTGRTSDNSGIFPPEVYEWAYTNDDVLSLLACELDGDKSLIIEE